MGFPRQEYRSGLPFPFPGELPRDQTMSPALAGGFFIAEPPGRFPALTYMVDIQRSHWKRLWCWEGLGQEEKGMTEDEMAGWHHWINGRESEWTPGVGDGQGGLACCDSWGGKQLDMTERLNWTELNWGTYDPSQEKTSANDNRLRVTKMMGLVHNTVSK